MKKISETTKLLNELSNLTKEKQNLLLNRVDTYLAKNKQYPIQKKEIKQSEPLLSPGSVGIFNGVGIHPKRIVRTITITETLEVV